MYTETGTEQDRSRMVENTLPFHSANENFGNSTQKFWWNGTCPVASYFHSNKVLHKLLPYSPTKENHGQPKGGVREMLIWNPDLTLFYAEMAVGDLGSRLGNCIMCVIPFPSPPQNKLFVPEWVPDLGQTIQIMWLFRLRSCSCLTWVKNMVLFVRGNREIWNAVAVESLLPDLKSSADGCSNQKGELCVNWSEEKRASHITMQSGLKACAAAAKLFYIKMLPSPNIGLERHFEWLLQWYAFYTFKDLL